MCVAVLLPAGVRLSDEQLAAMHKANRDSWGYGFLQEYPPNLTTRPHGYAGYIRVVKGTTPVEDAIAKYNSTLNTSPQLLKFPHLVHFRITTAGLTNYNNAHPFLMDHGALIHNGSFPSNIHSDHSDTAQFAQAIKSVAKPGMSKDALAWLGKCVGYNKLVFLWRDGTAQIVNEEAGTYLDNGVWVSNTHWRSRL